MGSPTAALIGILQDRIEALRADGNLNEALHAAITPALNPHLCSRRPVTPTTHRATPPDAIESFITRWE
jgi:hypothetical protein